MCKDKQMFALILAIFISVLFITGWVFADRSVTDLFNATSSLGIKNSVSAPVSAALPEFPAADFQIAYSNSEICTIDGCN